MDRFKPSVTHKAVARALRSGRLKRYPCEWHKCDKTRVEAHHPDYRFPLTVAWLCRVHHQAAHIGNSAEVKATSLDPSTYERIASDVRAQIEAGLLKPGDKLPSTRELCDQYEVSVTVVRMAVLVLRSEGRVVGVPGKGVYVLRHADVVE